MPMEFDEYGRMQLSGITGILGRRGPVIPPMPLIARSPQWATVLKRELEANPTCRGCNRPAETAHHVVPVGVDPTRELDPLNLVSVCVPCHFVLCHGGDWNTYVLDPRKLLRTRDRVRPALIRPRTEVTSD